MWWWRRCAHEARHHCEARRHPDCALPQRAPRAARRRIENSGSPIRTVHHRPHLRPPWHAVRHAAAQHCVQHGLMAVRAAATEARHHADPRERERDPGSTATPSWQQSSVASCRPPAQSQRATAVTRRGCHCHCRCQRNCHRQHSCHRHRQHSCRLHCQHSCHRHYLPSCRRHRGLRSHTPRLHPPRHPSMPASWPATC